MHTWWWRWHSAKEEPVPESQVQAGSLLGLIPLQKEYNTLNIAKFKIRYKWRSKISWKPLWLCREGASSKVPRKVFSWSQFQSSSPILPPCELPFREIAEKTLSRNLSSFNRIFSALVRSSGLSFVEVVFLFGNERTLGRVEITKKMMDGNKCPSCFIAMKNKRIRLEKRRERPSSVLKDDLGLWRPMCFRTRPIVHRINLKSTLRSLLLENPGPTSTATSPHVRKRGKPRFAPYPCFGSACC